MTLAKEHQREIVTVDSGVWRGIVTRQISKRNALGVKLYGGLRLCKFLV